MKDFLDELDNELNNDNSIPKNDNTDVVKKITHSHKFKAKVENKKPAQVEEQKQNLVIDQNVTKNSSNDNKKEFRWKFISSFPETKFYLPTLREWYTRFIPIWWNNETWAKNMWMMQYWDDIILIDCWVQFADIDMLWANYSIPDVSFLTKYTKNIKWFLITHAHLDHIWALKHILPALDFPVLYWTKLTIWILKKSIEEAWFLSRMTFIEVDAWLDTKYSVWPFKVEFFKVNHSVPDCAWLYIESPSWFKLVHTWDFKIDFTPAIDAPADLSRIYWIWKRWITLFLSDSTWASRKWFSKSEKDVWKTLEDIVKNHQKWRLIIATFSSWISRVQQLIDISEKYDKHIFLSGRSMVENVAIAKELWYLKIKPGIVKKMSPKTTEWIPANKQIIITTWSQWEQFSALARMAEGKHNSIEIIQWDTVVFSSSVVPWNEKSVVWIINKLIKLWANIITKDDWEVHTWWHAFQEEQKIMLKLVNPKYFMPVYWDLYFRHLHKMTAVSIWFNEENTVLLDNWNIVDFSTTWNIFRSKIKVPLQEIIIDWHGMWTADSHVIKAREKMMNSWVLVVLFKVDKKTKAILWYIKLETRWLVYLDEVRHIHRDIIKKARDIFENTIKDIPDIEEKELVKIIKTDLETFLARRIDREPMIIPIVMEV